MLPINLKKILVIQPIELAIEKTDENRQNQRVNIIGFI